MKDEHLDNVVAKLADSVFDRVSVRLHDEIRRFVSEGIRRCPRCGELFVMKTKRQQYCTDRCSLNGRQAKWQKAQRGKKR